MDREMTGILREAIKNPLYRQLAEYLTARRAMPDMKTGYLTDGTNGEFITSNGTDPKISPAGLVKLRYGNPSEAATSTLVHELTHAAARQMAYQKGEQQRAKLPNTQLANAYAKLMFEGNFFGASSEPQRDMINTLPGGKEFMRKGANYRTTDTELPAFAVGNTQNAAPHWPAPAHIDPTVATEFMILLDAAMRDMKANPGPQGR